MKLVGKVKEAHGLKGDLYVLVFSGDSSWKNHLKSFQLKKESTGEIQEFPVGKIKSFKKGVIVSTASIQDRTQAEAVEGFLFLVPEDLFVSESGETIYLAEILNFQLLNQANDLMGVISGFSSNGVQDLLIVKNEKGEHLVPFVAPWILEMDFPKKQVRMNLPVGLFGEVSE